jgi:hypothetical protein
VNNQGKYTLLQYHKHSANNCTFTLPHLLPSKIFTDMQTSIIKGDGMISFVGAAQGLWNVIAMKTLAGEPIEPIRKIDIIKGEVPAPVNEKSTWILRAFISNLRYTSRSEKNDLDQKSKGLGRPEFNRAALIPIKKSKEWWLLAQDERRKIFEEDSRHIRTSANYLGVISRQLHHCRDIGEPFDFLTWFEFSSEHDNKFDELCDILRNTEEWKYVVREVDIRLEK